MTDVLLLKYIVPWIRDQKNLISLGLLFYD
jgi:hypothetical protein